MQDYFLSFLNFFCKPILPIINDLEANQGQVYLVGGSVRDLLLGYPIKDLDIEVHKITSGQLEAILKTYGGVKFIGKKFGVFRITLKQNNFEVIDWSLPRIDSIGRKPMVAIDPNLGIIAALERRDLTINAMAIDLMQLAKDFNKLVQKANENKLYPATDFKIIDPYGGIQALAEKRLSAVNSERFIEDPLRFYRVMQFIGRFEFLPDNKLEYICKTMSLLDTTEKPISKERIYEEIKKLILQSKRPSLGFRWLLKIKRLSEVFPELADLESISQRNDCHPEGSVFEHTMQVLDAVARLTHKNTDEKVMLCLAGLCHDLGKTTSTTPEFSCRGHECTGVPLAKQFLKRLTNNTKLIASVKKLVLYHLMPRLLIEQKSTSTAFKRLAIKLAPEISLRQLGIISLADQQGRNGENQNPLTTWLESFNKFTQIIKTFGIEEKPEPPILQGKDLIDYCNPGPALGKLLKKAYEIQITEVIHDPKILKDRVTKK